MASVPAFDRDATASTRSFRALPAWVYSHAELHRLELERILRPSWQIGCHVSSIPNPGDFVTFDLGPDPVPQEGNADVAPL